MDWVAWDLVAPNSEACSGPEILHFPGGEWRVEGHPIGLDFRTRELAEQAAGMDLAHAWSLHCQQFIHPAQTPADEERVYDWICSIKARKGLPFTALERCWVDMRGMIDRRWYFDLERDLERERARAERNAQMHSELYGRWIGQQTLRERLANVALRAFLADPARPDWYEASGELHRALYALAEYLRNNAIIAEAATSVELRAAAERYQQSLTPEARELYGTADGKRLRKVRKSRTGVS